MILAIELDYIKEQLEVLHTFYLHYTIYVV